MKLSCQLITVVALIARIYGQQNIDLGQMQKNAMSELNNLLPSGQAQSVINSLQNQFMGPTGSATTIPTQTSSQDGPAPTSASGDSSGGSATSTSDGSGSSASTSSSAVVFTSSQGNNGNIASPVKFAYVIAGTLLSIVGSSLV